MKQIPLIKLLLLFPFFIGAASFLMATNPEGGRPIDLRIGHAVRTREFGIKLIGSASFTMEKLNPVGANCTLQGQGYSSFNPVGGGIGFYVDRFLHGNYWVPELDFVATSYHVMYDQRVTCNNNGVRDYSLDQANFYTLQLDIRPNLFYRFGKLKFGPEIGLYGRIPLYGYEFGFRKQDFVRLAENGAVVSENHTYLTDQQIKFRPRAQVGVAGGFTWRVHTLAHSILPHLVTLRVYWSPFKFYGEPTVRTLTASLAVGFRIARI
jgi:hypothetical protein